MCHQSTLHHGQPSGDRVDRVKELAFEVCEEKTAILMGGSVMGS